MLLKYRSQMVGVLAVLAVIVAAVVPELRHQPGNLLNKAHKVAMLGTWDQKQDNYFWLTNQEVLLITPAAASSFELSVQARRLNAQTGIITGDAPLQTALQKISGDSIVPDWQLSPNSQWLLSGGQFQNTPVVWVATAINGSKQIVRPRQQYYENGGLFTVWRPDSKAWVQIVEQNDQVHAFGYRLDNPAVTVHVENTNLNGNVAVGFYSPDRIFCIRPQTGDGGGIGVMDLGADASSAPVQNYIQNVPANMDVQEVSLSPDRKLLAWKFTVKPLPLGLKATINSGYVRRSAPTLAGLWVSDLNFNHLREIGTLDIRDDHVSNLRWTPDGKRLSFIDGDALYTVPIN